LLLIGEAEHIRSVISSAVLFINRAHLSRIDKDNGEDWPFPIQATDYLRTKRRYSRSADTEAALLIQNLDF
jgi:hypothetical protein